jgi:AbrB family looped-hinge helix DNA binding protein
LFTGDLASILLFEGGEGPFGMRKHNVTISPEGQVTIPVELRRALGLAEGGSVEVAYENGAVVLRSAQKPTLTALLADFDPAMHRHTADEREWDDAPQGDETL